MLVGEANLDYNFTSVASNKWTATTYDLVWLHPPTRLLNIFPVEI